MWSRRTSTPSRRTTGAAAGPGTRARPDGCIAPASKRSWASASGATFLLIDPCIPRDWPGFQVTLRHGTARYEIAVENPAGCGQGMVYAELDGVGMDWPEDFWPSRSTEAFTGCGSFLKRIALAA